MNRKLSTKLFSSGNKVMAFSERSGQPFPYNEMVVEKGTGLLVHRSEDDRDGNIQDATRDPIVPPDAQRLENPSAGPDVVNTLFLYLYDKATNEMLYTDRREQDGIVVIL